MAVYTEVRDDELSRFLAGYDVGQLLSYKGIAEGVENTNYLVSTERGPLFLTLYEKRVNSADLPFFLALMEHLAGAGIPCPVPVRDRKGEALAALAGRPAALITFLNGVSVAAPRSEHCAAVGRALAELHLAGQSFAPRRANALGLAGWRALFERLKGNADAIAAGLAAMIEGELDHLEASWPRALPAGVIHADLFPDNVFFLGPRISGLIDFYFACNDALAYDVAVALNAWCFAADQRFELAHGKALLAGYASVRPFSAAERDALPLLARGAALRFLLTRAWDWLHTSKDALVKKKDPGEFVRRLDFHRRATSASAYGFADRP
jgi:homoserine kinase type II